MRWKPMAEMTEELRDGRQVLFYSHNYEYMVALQYAGDNRVPHRSCWRFPWNGIEPFREDELTHFCEIEPPVEGKSDEHS